MGSFGKFERAVNLAQVHSGQIVTPSVTERGLGALLEVEVSIFDSSDRTNSKPVVRRFRAASIAARWVREQGIITDDSHSYI